MYDQNQESQAPIYIYIYKLTFEREGGRGRQNTKLARGGGVMTGRKLSNQNPIVTISTNV
jgi:hypothetical protein